MEIAFILFRCLVESLVNLKYLLKGNSNDLLHGNDRRLKPQHGPTKTVDMSKKRVVTNRFIVSFNAPMIPMIGSSLWRIDNRTGEVRCIYILPPDKPMIGGFDVEMDSKTVARSGKNMPLIYTS